MTRRNIATAVFFSAIFIFAGCLQAGTVIGLGTLGGDDSYGRAINNRGEVAGYSWDSNGYLRAFRYSGGAMQDLGSVTGTFGYSSGLAINNSGYVVGYSFGSNGVQAVRFADGAVDDLGTLGAFYAAAYSINDSGQIAGESTTSDFELHAFLYTGGVMKDLGTLGGGFSSGYGLSASGHVTGQSERSDGSVHAFRYADGVMEDLGDLAGHSGSSVGYAINDLGQITGQLETVDGGQYAFLYSNGVMQDLGLHSGLYGYSVGLGINSNGDVVGSSFSYDDGHQRAFLYSGGVMRDLNTLLPANSKWFLYEATGINDSGQIVGTGYYDGMSQSQAYLLNPTVTTVPEPSTWAMSLLGLIFATTCVFYRRGKPEELGPSVP
jgi:probable HAF family extracellular repeat protein